MTRILVLLALTASLFAAEVPIAEPAIIAGSPTFDRFSPSIAAGDAGFLVTWEERGFGVYPGLVMFRAYDRNGAPLQPVAMPAGPEYGRNPHVVWNGSEYLLVYAREISRFGSPSPLPAIIARRISAQGEVIADSEVVLAEAHGTGAVHDLEWAETEAFALVTADTQPYILRLSAHGTVTSSERMVVRPADLAAYGRGLVTISDKEGDAAALNPEHTIAALENTGAGVIVNFLTTSHNLLGGFVLAPNGSGATSIAWDGGAWIAAYIDGGGDVCTARFTGANDVVRSCRGERNALTPAIAVHAGRTFTAWSRERNQIFTDRGIVSTRIAAQGTPDATIDPAGLLFTWIEDERVHVGGAGRPIHLAGTRTRADSPRLSNAGAQTLLVWSEANTIRATRLDAAGTPVPPIADLGAGRAPSVTTDGTNWLVAWQNDNEAVSTFITPNLDSNGLQHYGAANTFQSGPRVSATPRGFLVVWNETQLAPEGQHDRIVAEPLDAGGLRVSGGVRVVDRVDGTRVHANTLALQCVGERCLIAWDDTSPGHANVRSVVVGADAKPLTEPRPLLGPVVFAPKAIVPFEGGGFRLYSGSTLFILGPDGETLATQRWTPDEIYLGAAVLFDNRPHLVYARAGRVFVRDIFPRGRAVRH